MPKFDSSCILVKIYIYIYVLVGGGGGGGGGGACPFRPLVAHHPS